MGSEVAHRDARVKYGGGKATNLSPFFLTSLRDPAMAFFQLGDIGLPYCGEDRQLMRHNMSQVMVH